MRDLFFYAVCAAMLFLAGLTVLARNLFRAALGLLGVLLGTAVLFVMLHAEMVALVQVMVYIGGIMIFVLYAVLLTSELGGRMASPSWPKAALGAITALAAFAWLGRLALGTSSPAREAAVADAGIAALKPLGARLLDPGPGGFLIAFELISILLLAAMVGAIAVARESKGGRP